MTAKLTKYIMNNVKCVTCKDALLDSHNDSPLAEAQYATAVLPGPMVHPNHKLWDLIGFLEESFGKHCRSESILDDILGDVMDQYQLSFPCTEHAHNVLAKLIHCFILTRMQQYASRFNVEKKMFKIHEELTYVFNLLFSLGC